MFTEVLVKSSDLNFFINNEAHEDHEGFDWILYKEAQVLLCCGEIMGHCPKALTSE